MNENIFIIITRHLGDEEEIMNDEEEQNNNDEERVFFFQESNESFGEKAFNEFFADPEENEVNNVYIPFPHHNEEQGADKTIENIIENHEEHHPEEQQNLNRRQVISTMKKLMNNIT